MTESLAIAGILVAALGGAAIGVERQRSGHATGARARFGGVRTFTLLGGLAGLAGWLAALQYTAFAAVLAAGAVGIVVVAYAAASQRDVDGTTEVAALVVIAAGVAAGLGFMALASGVFALTTLLLVEKSRLHAIVARIDDEELRATARFAVMAVVILPLLPTGPFGALGGVRPRELWLLVLFFTGLSFIGYVARRIFGAAHGYPLAGVLAGVVSSTNATFTFARLSRREGTLSKTLALGTIGACTMLFPRVLVAASVLNLSVARNLLVYLVPPFLVGLAAFVVSWRRTTDGLEVETMPSNPLQFGPALQMAVLFQGVMFVVTAVRDLFGEGGLLLTGGVLGLTDVDALTISMSHVATQGVPVAIAAKAIAIGVLANCGLKMGLALVLGTRVFGRAASVPLAAMVAAILFSLAVMR
jgi:uncharacterized membrane protein (DUF4010 family)